MMGCQNIKIPWEQCTCTLLLILLLTVSCAVSTKSEKNLPSNSVTITLNEEERYGGSMSPLQTARVIDAEFNHFNNIRFKRDTSASSSQKQDSNDDASSHKLISKSEPGHEPSVTRFELKDPHHQVMVGWAGEGSQVIVCVTKDSVQTINSTSKVYISYDYGTTYQDKTSEFTIEGNKTGVVYKFYKNEKFTDRFLFADTLNKYLYVTMDYGHTIYPRKLNFSPSEVSNHPTNALTVAVLDADDKMKKLWMTTDFGETWRILSLYVKSYYWSDKTSPPTLYVERAGPGDDNRVLAFQNFISVGDFEHTVVTNDVQDFKVKEEFLFAIKKKPRLYGAPYHEDTLQLWISFKGGPFLLSEFPNNLTHQHYYIADISYGQIMVCVFHGISSNLYVSSVPSSSDQQIKFSLSLERILYFHPNTNWNNTWLDQVAEDAFADLHRVKGIRGVFIASQLFSNYTKMSRKLGPEHLNSVITFDQGGEWKPISAPKVDNEGLKTDCDLAKGCSLHISQELASLYPGTRSKPILSAESAPGLILATGTLGMSLKGHMGVFLSTDAGINWYQMLRGNYLYTFGDHGAVIVAVEQYPLNGPTNEILYSTDEGETWHSHRFSDEAMKVYGLMIEPGENTTIFTLFGSREEKHEWILVKIDMRPVFSYKCTKEDYKKWTPSLHDSSNGYLCLLGRKDVFEKRIPHSNCYNGISYDRPISEDNCPCSRQDYECDFGFVANSKSEECMRDTTDTINPLSIPLSCKQGNFYNRSKGYRKIPGDTCIGGLEAMYDPELLPCPLNEEREFFLISSRKKILRYDLLNPSDGLQALPVTGLEAVIALDFDLSSNCLYWSDATTKKIMRLYFDGEHQAEALVESNIDSIEGLALDWVSKNLYFVDGGRKIIEAIRIDKNFTGRLRTTVIKKGHFDLPRGIALHPVRGYMFITDWSESKPMVARAYLDGTNIKKLFGGDKVGWPNGITVDFQTERLFFADAKLDYIASSDFDGQNFHKIISENEYVKQPFAVGVYKSMIFWDDWSMYQVFQADKEHGWAVTPVSHTPMEGLVDLKVFGHWTQKGSNACGESNTCQFLCMGTPDNGFSCKCPDWMTDVQEKNHTKCICGDGSEPSEFGACLATDSTCSSEFFKCDNNYCIPKSMVCDKDNDCGDFSDEKNCGENACDASSWQCKNGHCISPVWKCDIDNDCGDNSDEEGCVYPKCAATEFTCNNKRCIDKRWMCDLQDDCRDGSDEANCTFPGHNKGHGLCRGSQFQCKSSGVCLPISWRCDGESDCGDGSDEMNCTSHKCSVWQFQCSSKRCIYMTWVCDGEKDCEDGSDELNCTGSTPVPHPTPNPFFPTNKNNTCSSFEFRCTSGNCVPFWWRCDKAKDCDDGSDEEDCSDIFPPDSGHPGGSQKPPTTTSKPDKYTCREDQMECGNGECVWLAWVCDGDKDCSSGEDEENCHQKVRCLPDEFRCWHSEGCIDTKLRCNGHNDCADGSDEMGCLPVSPKTPTELPKCSAGWFSCDGGNCLHESKRCDSNVDCIDMSDEKDCSNQTGKVYQVSRVQPKDVTNLSLTFTWEMDVPDPLKPDDFEYKPSCIVKAALGNPSAWRNGTWVTEKEYTFDKLDSFTDYLLKVYVRNKLVNKEYPPAEMLTMKTGEGVPTPPVDLEVTQAGEGLQLKWKEPHHPNGPITSYQVYVTPPDPPRGYKVNGDTHELYFVPSQEDQNFTIWMTATNSLFTSFYSEKIQFTPTSVDHPVNGLSVRSKDISTVDLVWEPLLGVDGYIVSYMYPENQFMGFKHVINVTESNIHLTSLAPGLKYVFEVQGYKGLAVGPFTTLEVMTVGEKLPSVNQLKHMVQKNPGTEVKITWEEPPYKQKHLWQYQILWGKTMTELKNRLNLATTTNTTYTIYHLDACETYMMAIMISGPIGTGPAVEFQVQTNEDPLSPPKNLRAKADRDFMDISWEAPCPQAMDTKLRYLVNITETSLDRKFFFDVPSRNTSVTQGHRIQMHHGGNYIITIRTYLNNSRPSLPVFLSGPNIPAPYELTFNPIDDSFFWRNQKNLQPELLTQNYSYMLFLSRVDTNNTDPEYSIEVQKPPYVSNELSPGQIYFASVAFKDNDGYLSSPSQSIRVEKPVGDSIVMTQTSVVGVAISVIIVIIILVVIVGVMAVRHKRLARSFSSFANSHYDRFQGTTLIATDHSLDEDDSPMIRGFSDDEPLVIA